MSENCIRRIVLNSTAAGAGGTGDQLTAIPVTVDWADGGRLDLIIDAILVDTAQMNLGIVVGIVENNDLTTTTCRTDLAETTNDHYIGRIITFTSNVLSGQSSDITDYTGATGVVTFTAMTESATSEDTFKIT